MCSALRDKRELKRNAAGLWQCSCVGNERDAVTLTKGNAEASRAAAQRLRVPAEITGRFQNDQVTAISATTGMLMTEDSSPLTSEDGLTLLLET